MGRKQPPQEPQENDFGTPEARRQAFSVVEQPDPSDRSTRRTRVEQSQVEWYLRRHWINQVEADAGTKWGVDAYLCGLQPACIGGYQQAINGGDADVSDIRLAAQARRANAIKALEHIRLGARLIDAVAVDGRNAGRFVMEHGLATPGEAVSILRYCLQILAKHYGLAR